MVTEVEGLIIKETTYGETSKIINIYTREYGVIGVMCKGAKSIKSKLRASTMKLNYAKFNIYYKENKLSLLSSVDIINPLKNIKSDIILISYATYLIDLLTQVLKQNTDESLYDEFISAILKIEDRMDASIITNILEVKYLDYLGVGLNLTSCSVCGTKKDILTLSTEKGGLICKNCYTNERIMSLDAIKILNMYYLVDIKSITSLNIKDNIKEEINNFLNIYYEDFTGLYLKSKDFLHQMNDIK